MRALVVHAHPVAASFNRVLNELVCATLEARGHEVRNLDLYAENFMPVMSEAERLGYHDEGGNIAPVRAHLEQLAWCSGLVFVYPTWWYGQPAILKGWLDRVFVPHVTFAMPVGNQPVRPLLQHIGCIGGVSTYGAPWLWTRWVGDPGRRILMRGVRALVHPRAKTFWAAHYQMDSSTPESRSAFMRQVVRKLEALPLEVPGEPLRMPLGEPRASAAADR
jgi:putative NADPH-quinone reductase